MLQSLIYCFCSCCLCCCCGRGSSVSACLGLLAEGWAAHDHCAERLCWLWPVLSLVGRGRLQKRSGSRSGGTCYVSSVYDPCVTRRPPCRLHILSWATTPPSTSPWPCPTWRQPTRSQLQVLWQTVWNSFTTCHSSPGPHWWKTLQLSALWLSGHTKAPCQESLTEETQRAYIRSPNTVTEPRLTV